jgi:ATP-dependent DNA helicase PIF1
MGLIKQIINSLNEKNNVILYGPGGCGKSYTITKLVTRLHKKIACTATTGIAAVNLASENNRVSTLHSWAGVGLGQGSWDKLAGYIENNNKSLKRWKNTEILIVDEVSMLGLSLFEKLDKIGRYLRKQPTIPFGGIQIILSGDFLQLAPVKDQWIFKSDSFRQLDFKYYLFDQPKRYVGGNSEDFFKLLSRLRVGHVIEDDIETLEACHTKYIEYLKDVTDHSRLKDNQNLIVKPTKLYSTRVNVIAENMQELNKLPGKAYDFKSKDTFMRKDPDSDVTKEQYMKILEDAIPESIQLKVGAQVVLKRNLDFDEGLVNGSRGVVTEILDDKIEGIQVNVKFYNGVSRMIKKEVWENGDKKARVSRSQIPLLLAWASTIHGCQGCTMDYVICDVGETIFLPGQAYVELSRVRSLDGLLISSLVPKKITADNQVLEFISKLSFENEPSSHHFSSTEIKESPLQIEISEIPLKIKPIIKKAPLKEEKVEIKPVLKKKKEIINKPSLVKVTKEPEIVKKVSIKPKMLPVQKDKEKPKRFLKPTPKEESIDDETKIIKPIVGKPKRFLKSISSPIIKESDEEFKEKPKRFLKSIPVQKESSKESIVEKPKRFLKPMKK